MSTNYCVHLVEFVAGGVHCRKNGGNEITCSHGACRHCADGGGVDAAWKLRVDNNPQPTTSQSCQGCGGAKYNPQNFNRPGGMDELIQQLG